MLHNSGTEIKKNIEKDVNYHLPSIYRIFLLRMLHNSGNEKIYIKKNGEYQLSNICSIFDGKSFITQVMKQKII